MFFERDTRDRAEPGVNREAKEGPYRNYRCHAEIRRRTCEQNSRTSQLSAQSANARRIVRRLLDFTSRAGKDVQILLRGRVYVIRL